MSRHTKKYNNNKTKKNNDNIKLLSRDNIQYYQNKDGVKLLIMPNKSDSSTSSIYFYFKVGSKNEDEHLSGISHLVEHMVFKGSKKYKNYFDISRTLDSKGIEFNAFTTKEITGYNFKFLSTFDNINLILNIGLDMCLNPIMRLKDFKLEKDVVIQEYKDDIDDIDEFIEDETDKILLPNHSLSRPISGSLKSLQNITLTDIKNYYKKYYTLNNLLIGISGNINYKLFKLLNHHFSIFTKYDYKKLHCNPIPLYPFIDTQKNTIIKCIPKSLEQDYIHIIFKTKGFTDVYNNNIYKLICNILGGNMSSRFFVELREKLGLVYTVKCNLVNYEEVGYVLIYLQCEHNKTLKCLDTILFELYKFINEGLIKTELESFKTNYINKFLSSFDDIENENEYYCEQILFNKKIETIKDKVNFIKSINENDIKNISRHLFDLNLATFIIFGKCSFGNYNNHIKKIIDKYKKKTI